MRLSKNFEMGHDSPLAEVLNLKIRSDLHLARKAYHFFGVMLIIGLYHVLTREQGLITIGIATPLLLFFDFLRLRWRPLNRVAFQFLNRFLRREEMNRLSGMAYLLVGAFIVIVFFPKTIGMLSFFFLAIGDPLSSIVGILYGKDKLFRGKSLQGTFAGFLVCTIISAIYFHTTGLMQDRLILVSVLGGLIGAISEAFPFGKIDDNFVIPVLSASMLYIMFLTFGGFI